MKRSLKDVASLPAWCQTNGIVLNNVILSESPDGYGIGLLATTSNPNPKSPFIQVPSHLLLSKDRVRELASEDEDLAQILELNGDFAATMRGAILLFLLMQITHSSPDILASGYERLPIGKPNPFAEYVQYIQTETALPSFWHDEEVALLRGTSLAYHHVAKMRSLYNEFETFKSACKELHWERLWFGDRGCLTFHDWLTVDAMWRSRAMDLGDEPDDDKQDCLVPVMDMANHSADGTAAYKLAKDNGGMCAQLTRDKILTPMSVEGNITFHENYKHVEKGTEITISYGNTKGAAEMIFSYGFLENDFDDARSLMLSWQLPEDDPLRFEKVIALHLEPGIQIFTSKSDPEEVCFAGAAIWAMSVNEEDGLKIVVDGTPDVPGSDNLSAVESGKEPEETVAHKFKLYFKDTLITSKSHLIDVLEHDRASLVFRTRAYAYVLMRVQDELGRLESLSQTQQTSDEAETTVSPQRAAMCRRLRELELTLLNKAFAYFSAQVEMLMDHPDIVGYSSLLEQGRSLPDLSDDERWARGDFGRDGANRVGYTAKLKGRLDDSGLGQDGAWDD